MFRKAFSASRVPGIRTKEDRIGQGKKNAADWLRANPVEADAIEREIRQRLLPHTDNNGIDATPAEEYNGE